MAIQVKCPRCDEEFYVTHELMGKRAKCLKCGGPVDVPKVNATKVRFDDVPEPFVPATPRQRAYLRSLGVECASGTSMEDATELIRNALARNAEQKPKQEAPKESNADQSNNLER